MPNANETQEGAGPAGAPQGTSQYSDGKPDNRLSTGPVSRFRPRYRKLTDEEMKLHDEIKAQAVVMEQMFNQVNGGAHTRYKSLAFTALEESVMWIVKDLTS